MFYCDKAPVDPDPRAANGRPPSEGHLSIHAPEVEHTEAGLTNLTLSERMIFSPSCSVLRLKQKRRAKRKGKSECKAQT